MGGTEEVVMLVEQSSMQGDQCLPLLSAWFAKTLCLLSDSLNTFLHSYDY